MNAAGEEPLISVIAVTHNSSHAMPSWLDAVDASPARGKMHICVVDSGSSADELRRTKEITAGRIDEIVELPNVGYGAANNVGAAHAEAPILLIMNPDAQLVSLPERIVSAESLEGELIGAHARNPDRPLAYSDYPSFGEEAQRLTIGAWIRTYARTVREPAWVEGAALLVGREEFLALGGFSDAFFLYFEDADLCVRYRTRGGRIHIDDDFVVQHTHGDSTVRESHSNLKGALDSINHQSARQFAARHGAPWQPSVLYLLLAVAYLPRRFLVEVIRERRSLAEAVEHCRCLLSTRRALRQLDAVPPRAART